MNKKTALTFIISLLTLALIWGCNVLTPPVFGQFFQQVALCLFYAFLALCVILFLVAMFRKQEPVPPGASEEKLETFPM
jgi:hypothetical protein